MDSALGLLHVLSEKERLRAGEIAFRDRPGGGTVYLRRIKDTDRALRIEWVGAYEYLALYYTIIVLLVTTALALILFRLDAPLWRDLEALKAATARVGEGDFGVRAVVRAARCSSPSRPAFNSMAGRVQALLQSAPRPRAGVAHELRTPLAQLKFDLELARTSASTASDRERFAPMERDVVDLEDLVSELLVLANLREAPPYQPRDVPPQTSSTSAAPRARRDARRGRDIAIEPPRNSREPLVRRKYLARALVNVLRNAVRYAHSQVALTSSAPGSRTTISVDDDGPGVPPLERERLFEPFTRWRLARPRRGGVGWASRS
jgi:signal transduction histidine kinase